MAWQDNLQLDGKGSFRDVEFFVDSAESTVGRRTVLHEFPGADHVESEDLGRAPRRFTFNAYVLGPNYMAARDRLRAAFEQAGPGPLVHPYWGEFVVAIEGTTRIRETVGDGGMARFTLSVVRISEDIVQVVGADTASLVDTAATTANTAAGEDLEDAWTVTGVIEAVRDEAQALIDGVNGITSVLNTVNGYVNAVMNTVNTVGESITDLADAASTLILTPAAMVSQIQTTVVAIIESIDEIGDAWDSYFTEDEAAGSVAGNPETSPTAITPASGDQRVGVLMAVFRDLVAYGSGFSTVSETTPQREAQADNQAAMVVLFRSIAVAEVCRAAANAPFVSYDLAVSVRDELSDQLDALAETADDITYAALVDLRSAVVKHLTDASADLPRVITHTPSTSLPALVIAQQLYSDSTRDADLIERNNIRNPCRVPGGEDLEVLSRE